MLGGCHSTSLEAPPLPSNLRASQHYNITNSRPGSGSCTHRTNLGYLEEGELLLSPAMEDEPCQEGQSYLEMYH